uniref:Uncharacterized protein n=1 Tax=Knipowitschia caucasica TaxID=637954 RepID=A0AAV2J6J1_KNICA
MFCNDTGAQWGGGGWHEGGGGRKKGGSMWGKGGLSAIDRQRAVRGVGSARIHCVGIMIDVTVEGTKVCADNDECAPRVRRPNAARWIMRCAAVSTCLCFIKDGGAVRCAVCVAACPRSSSWC